MEKIKIGVVGAGIYGNYHIHTYHTDHHVERVVCCDTDDQRRQATADKYGIKGYATMQEMLKEESLDAISIATPDPYHMTPAKEAIQAGIKYIFIEKPLATTVEECEELLHLAKVHDVQIAVDFHKRWDPAYLCMKEELEKDKETIVRGYMSLDDIIDVPTSWFTWTNQSSPAWFLGVHCYDLIRYLTNSEVVSVYAVGNKTVLKKQGYQTYDNIQAILTMKNGSHFTVENAWILPHTFPKSNDGKLVILSENKYLKNESYRGVKTYTNQKANLPNYIFMNFTLDRASGFGLEPMQEFVYDILHQNTFRATAFDGLQATRIAAAVHASIEQNTIVLLQQ